MAFMQVVAAVDGRLVSLFDGVTQYKLGQTLHAKRGGAAWAPLDACYYAFPTMQQVHSRLKPHCQSCFPDGLGLETLLQTYVDLQSLAKCLEFE